MFLPFTNVLWINQTSFCWIDVVIVVAQTWLSRFLCHPLCTLSVITPPPPPTHTHTHNHCADLPMQFHWGSPSCLNFSPLSLLTYFSVPPILSSTEGREDLSHTHSLLLKNDGRLSDETYLWTIWLRRVHYPAVTWTPWFFRGRKMGKNGECRPKHEHGEQLMVLPEDVLEVWRDVNHSSIVLPPSLSFSLLLSLAAFRACSKHFWDSGRLSFFHLFCPLLSRRVCLFKRDGDSPTWRRSICIASLRAGTSSKPPRIMGRDRSLSRHFRYGTFSVI